MPRNKFSKYKKRLVTIDKMFLLQVWASVIKPVFTNLSLWMLKEIHNKAILSDTF